MKEKNFVNRINKTESRGIKFAAQEVVEGGGEKELKSLTREEKERREEIRKKLVKAINEVLKEDGFEKQASTWRKETKDVIQVVNLQRGRYAFLYFLNIGVLKKEFNPDNKKPACEECHFNERFEYLNKEDDSEEVQERAREKRRILDFEDASDTDVEEKIIKIKEIIEKEILPFFSNFDIDEFIRVKKQKTQ